MLIPLNQPDCAPDLMLATELAAHMLKYIVDNFGNVQPADLKAHLKTVFLPAAQRFKQKGIEDTVDKIVNAIVGAVDTALNPPSKKKRNGEEVPRKKLTAIEWEEVLNSFCHDVQFDIYMVRSGEQGFYFRFPNLPKPVHEIGVKLLGMFYTKLFGEIGFTWLYGQSKNYCLNRSSFEASYRRANQHNDMVLCPACLEELDAPMGAGLYNQDFPHNARSLVERDHFFPKSIYSPLVLHPSNLVLIHAHCNQKKKAAKNPIIKDDKDQLLLSDSYTPYHTSVLKNGIADDIELRFKSAGQQDNIFPNLYTQVRIGSNADKRVKNFDRLYDLALFWSSQLQIYVQKIIGEVIEHYNTSIAGKTHKPAPTVRQLDSILHNLYINTYSRGRLTRPYAYVQQHYIKWLSVNPSNRKSFLEQCRKLWTPPEDSGDDLDDWMALQFEEVEPITDPIITQ